MSEGPKNTEKTFPQTSGASDCWGNLSILSGENARACGFSHEVVLYRNSSKKHYNVQTNLNKSYLEKGNQISVLEFPS